MALLRQCLYELRAEQARRQADAPRAARRTQTFERPTATAVALQPLASTLAEPGRAMAQAVHPISH